MVLQFNSCTIPALKCQLKKSVNHYLLQFFWITKVSLNQECTVSTSSKYQCTFITCVLLICCVPVPHMYASRLKTTATKNQNRGQFNDQWPCNTVLSPTFFYWQFLRRPKVSLNQECTVSSSLKYQCTFISCVLLVCCVPVPHMYASGSKTTATKNQNQGQFNDHVIRCWVQHFLAFGVPDGRSMLYVSRSVGFIRIPRW